MPTPTGSTSYVFSTPTNDPNQNSMGYGTQWSNTSLTYSFIHSGSYFSKNYPENNAYLTFFSAAQQTRITEILTVFSNVSALRFTQSVDDIQTVGDIRFGFSWLNSNNNAYAWAYLPGPNAYHGDVWLNRGYPSLLNSTWSDGSYACMSIMHELGHAMGLKHPFASSIYNEAILDSALDSRSYTLMSYSAEAGNQDTYFSFEPSTLMILDIGAIQALYGANTSYHGQNDTYRFTDEGSYHQTIWDAGGEDTIAYDGSTNAIINLTAGLAGGSQMGNPIYILDSSGAQLARVNNIWIANNTFIENAQGGSGDDTLTGNSNINLLEGGLGDDELIGLAGNDKLYGHAGNDYLDGGLGDDLMVGGPGDDHYYVDSLKDSITEQDNEGIDTVYTSLSMNLGKMIHVENITSIASTKTTLIGNDRDNHIIGSASNDSMQGGAGHDYLNGGLGADKMVGGSGDDIFIIDDLRDSVSDASGTDTIITTLNTLSLNAFKSVEQLQYVGTDHANLSGNLLQNTIVGHSGDDRIDGGLGNDTLTGGAGIDHFIFSTALKNNMDTITDFTTGTDRLGLSLKIFTKLKNDTDLSDNFCINSAQDSNDYLIFNTSNHTLYYDADGSGIKSAALAIAIIGCPLQASDILII